MSAVNSIGLLLARNPGCKASVELIGGMYHIVMVKPSGEPLRAVSSTLLGAISRLRVLSDL